MRSNWLACLFVLAGCPDVNTDSNDVATPVVEFDPTTDPYSAEQLRAFRDERHIRWIIVKTDLQSPRLATLDAKASTMIDGFILVDRVGSYSVYRRP